MAMKIEKIGKVSSLSVHKGTGKHWDEWIKILEKSGARSLTHKEIVAFLKKKYKLTPWWQQGVTHGFELHIGLKAEGRNLKGEFMTMASRTLAVDVKGSWKFLNSERGLAIWLKPMGDFNIEPKAQFEVEGGIFGEVRTCKPALRARLSWQEEEWAKPSILQIYLIPRSKVKSLIVFTHEKLPSDRLRLQMREHWKSVVDDIHDYFKKHRP